MNRRSMMRASVGLSATMMRLTSSAQQLATASAQTSAGNKPPFFSEDLQFWYEALRAFGAASYGGSEFGEVYVTVAGIEAGNYDSWYEQWNRIAERVEADGVEQLKRGHAISARDSFLRATTYYRNSEFFLHGTPQDTRVNHAYTKSVACYKSSAKLFDFPIEPVEIPYEHTTLPGYFHRSSSSGTARPTVVMHSGFDGSAEELHLDGARAAVERGYNVLAFDGPGQYGPIHREGLTFRPDWENVVGPVLDYALSRPEVDPRKIALMGVSFGGELAPRAAAFEKRIAALIANDGIYDFGAANLSGIPPAKRAALVPLLSAKEAPQVDSMLAAAMQSSPTVRWALTQGMYTMGAATPRAYLSKAMAYNLRNGVAEAIRCPTLVCSAEGDTFFKGQADELFEHLTCSKTIIRFPEAEGGGEHCQIGARRMAYARIYDWLDETISQPVVQSAT